MKKIFKALIKICIIGILGLGLYKSYTLYQQNVLEKKQKQENLSSLERSFVVIVFPQETHNEGLEEKNILSILTQDYTDFKVIYLYNDETPNSLDKTKNLIAYLGKTNQVTFLPLSQNNSILLNLYEAVQNCEDEEIILPVSNQDFLAHDSVLTKLNNLYKTPFVWMTYGSFLDYPSYKTLPQSSKPFPKNTVFNNSYRSHTIPNLYPITCYAGLFKKIQRKDLETLPETLFLADNSVGYAIPLLEMTGKHARFVNEIFYLHSRNAEELAPIREESLLYLKKQAKYKRLKELPFQIVPPTEKK